MNTTDKVVWTKTAEHDLGQIIEYIAKKNPSRALTMLRKIRKTTFNLYHTPKRGRIVPELQEQGILHCNTEN